MTPTIDDVDRAVITAELLERTLALALSLVALRTSDIELADRMFVELVRMADRAVSAGGCVSEFRLRRASRSLFAATVIASRGRKQNRVEVTQNHGTRRGVCVS